MVVADIAEQPVFAICISIVHGVDPAIDSCCNACCQQAFIAAIFVLIAIAIQQKKNAELLCPVQHSLF